MSVSHSCSVSCGRLGNSPKGSSFLVVHCCKTPRIAGLDMSTAIIMGALMSWGDNFLNCVECTFCVVTQTDDFHVSTELVY